MAHTFKPVEIALLFGFALGLAAVDAFSRSGSSGCAQCELDLLQRSAAQTPAESRLPSTHERHELPSRAELPNRGADS